MNHMQGLLWEQWRQSRYWVSGSAALLLMMSVAVGLFRPWFLRQVIEDPYVLEMFGWIIGLTAVGLMFVNPRMRDMTFQFPQRQFALPCRTGHLVAMYLAYKSLVAIVLGVFISMYHWAVFEEAGPSALPALFLLALAAAGQALVMIAAVLGPWSAVGAGVATGAIALGLFGLLQSWGFAPTGAATLTAVGVLALGWCTALACGPTARHGRVHGMGPIPLLRIHSLAMQLFQPLIVRWEFSSPLWAQCWFEWRRAIVWVPRIVLPVAAVLSFDVVRGGNEDAALLLLLATGATAASALGCFLLRVPESEARFLLGHPDGERALVDGKLLAALVAALSTSIATSAIVAFAGIVATWFDAQQVADEMFRAIPIIFIVQTGLIWIGLTSTPFYLAGTVAGTVVGFCLITPVALLLGLGLNETLVGIICISALAGLLYAAYRKLRPWRILIPWEVALFAVAGLVELAHSNGYDFILLEDLRPDHRFNFLAATFLLLGGLLYARRIGLITARRCTVAYAGYLAVCAVFAVIIEMGPSWGPLTQADTVFWWIAACFAPVAWVPLAVRLQRYQ